MIYHIAIRADWALQAEAPTYVPDSYQRDGFVHCCESYQLETVAEYNFRGRSDLVLLEIMPTKLEPETRYEQGGREKYPHIYGPINTGAIRRSIELAGNSDGSFTGVFDRLSPQLASRHRTDVAARRLAYAWRSGDRIPDPGAARPRSRDEAYAIQDAVTGLLGLPVVGWKVGAATPAIMQQRGLDEPIPGPLFGPRVYAGAAELPAADFPAANLETEFAFRTLAELPPRRAPYEPAALAAVSELLAAFDLTQSRYSVAPDSLAEIADSGNSGGAVIGTPIPDWRDRDLLRVTVELHVDGGAPVATYSGAWRRDPLDVLA